MAVKATNTRILVDRYNLSGTSNALTIATDAQALEYSVFQTPDVQFIPGNPVASIEHSGYYNGPDAGGIELELYNRLVNAATPPDSLVAAVLDTAGTIPVAFVISSTYNSQQTIDSPVEQLITVVGNWPVKTGQMYRGYQLHVGSITEVGTSTPVDFGAIGAAGGKAWIFIFTIVGGATNAAIEVQTDTAVGFGSPVTRGTFTFSGVGAEEIDLATVEQFFRINTTDMGGATSFNVCVIAGANGVTM